MPLEQRLWAAPDGAVCMVKVRGDAPHFEVLVVRSGTVLARRRFYAEASAYMLGESWRPAPVPNRWDDTSPVEQHF